MDITIIFDCVIALLAAVITIFVIPWLKGKLSAQDMTDFLRWVEIGVAAAQQMYHQLDGAKRLEYVMEFLSAKGYDVDREEVRNAIEAAVLKLHKELGV